MKFDKPIALSLQQSTLLIIILVIHRTHSPFLREAPHAPGQGGHESHIQLKVWGFFGMDSRKSKVLPLDLEIHKLKRYTLDWRTTIEQE